MARCSSLCDLTPPALGFVISSCQDLLIGSPQAELTQRLYIGKLSINWPQSVFHHWKSKISGLNELLIYFNINGNLSMEGYNSPPKNETKWKKKKLHKWIKMPQRNNKIIVGLHFLGSGHTAHNSPLICLYKNYNMKKNASLNSPSPSMTVVCLCS